MYIHEVLKVGIYLFHRNNAGMYSQNLEFSEEKIEMTFATNYLGTFPILYLFLAVLNHETNKLKKQSRA